MSENETLKEPTTDRPADSPAAPSPPPGSASPTPGLLDAFLADLPREVPMEEIDRHFSKKKSARKKKPSLDGYCPTEEWHSDPATSMQTGRLRDHDLDWDGDLTKGEACYLLGQCVARGALRQVAPEEED